MSPDRRNFDGVAAIYDETRGGERRGRIFAEVVSPLLGDARRVLDVGVGTGLVALGLSELGHDVIGVDISEAMLSRARDRMGARCAGADVVALPFPAGTFDGAHSMWVVHLLPDVPGALREVARVLRPGGRYVVVTTLATPSERDAIGRIVDDMWLQLRRHVTRVDATHRVSEACVGTGLEIAEVARSPWTTFEETPADVADLIAGRAYSPLWDVTDDEWAAAVEPTIERLRRMPGSHMPHTRETSHAVVVLQRAT